jgi:hypothetical protein
LLEDEQPITVRDIGNDFVFLDRNIVGVHRVWRDGCGVSQTSAAFARRKRC